MVDGRASVSSALMHLFYYQQGLFSAEAEQSSIYPEEAETGWPRESQDAPPSLSHEAFAQSSAPPQEQGAPSAASVERSSTAEDRARTGRALRARCAELQAKLEAGALREENQVLESNVLKMQEDFIALQTDFKDVKDQYGERLDALRLALEEQQSVAGHAERRVVCTEDLVRFHEEQRRLMAGHWKQQCQMKDERIRSLNLQLTEYTIDWQHLGVQRQTEASLSHEFHCLEDRHLRLMESRSLQGASSSMGRLNAQLAEARVEEQQLSEASSAATEFERKSIETQALRVALESQIKLVGEWQRREEEAESLEPPLEHSCIWRDELDIREGQLEKITAMLDKTNGALHSAQVALSSQRARHEEMKSRHAEAEAQLREGERSRVTRQRRCQELRHVESILQRLLEADLQEHPSPSASGASKDKRRNSA